MLRGISIPTAAALGAIPASEKGQPNGVATLDGSGKIPTSEMPVGDVTYKGNWNGATNTPTLADGVGAAGDLHICDVAGTQNLGGGSVAYGVGDWLIYDGTVWDRVPGAGAAPANPSVTVALAAKNGSALTFMRSDAAPALDQTIEPTWTGAHAFTQPLTVLPAGGNGIVTTGTNSAGIPSIAATGAAANITLDISAKGGSGINLKSPTAVTGTLSATGNATFSASATFGGNVAVAGLLGSANNTTMPSPTNSGITLGGNPTWAMQSFYDQSLTANNRTADLLFISQGIKFRFVNDARTAFLDALTINGGQALGITGITSSSGSGAWAHSGAFSVSGAATLTGGVTSYKGVSTVGNGVASVYAKDDRGTQGADIAAVTIYAVPAGKGGLYRVSCYGVVSRAATTSSTLPNIGILWTDDTTNTALTASNVTSTNTANAVGAFAQGVQIISARESTNIQFQTSNYASSGATSMQYATHIIVEYIG